MVVTGKGGIALYFFYSPGLIVRALSSFILFMSNFYPAALLLRHRYKDTT